MISVLLFFSLCNIVLFHVSSLKCSSREVVYFHETHVVKEWTDRLGHFDKKFIAVCHDEEVGREAKGQGFKDVFFAKQANAMGLYTAVTKAVEYAQRQRMPSGGGSGGY